MKGRLWRHLAACAACFFSAAGCADLAVGAAPAPGTLQGLWYNAPAESEAGWGLNIAHQGDVLFATWFTYDDKGKAWWLAMTATLQTDGSFAGSLVKTSGPAFDAVPFDPALITVTPVGTGTLRFADADSGNFTYTIGGTTQTKSITHQRFGPLPACSSAGAGDLAGATNYQDLWWAAPAGVESGWGINFSHQGDIIFATWFTYESGGAPMWLSATLTKTASNVFAGDLYRTTGPAFSTVPFLPAHVAASKVGTLAVTFANGNDATLAYAVGGVSQSKKITRQVFQPPGTVCSNRSPAAGIWHGATASGNLVDGVVLDDGSYYVVVRRASNGDPLAGLQGSSSAADGTFTSTSARNVPYLGAVAGGASVVVGTYVAGSSLQLTVGAGATAESISLSYDAAYATPASLASVAGSYSGYNTHLDDVRLPGTLTIDSAGSVMMVGHCTFTGSVAPHGTTGLFDFTLVSHGVCLGGAGKSATGVLTYDAGSRTVMGFLPLFNDDMVYVNETKR